MCEGAGKMAQLRNSRYSKDQKAGYCDSPKQRRRNDGTRKEKRGLFRERKDEAPSEKKQNINSTVADDSDCDGYGGCGDCDGCRYADGHAEKNESGSASRGGIHRGASGG